MTMFADRPWPILRYAPAIVLIAALPALAPNDFYLRLASDVAFLAIAAIGLNILIGLSGQLSIGHAGFFSIGGYTSAILSFAYHWPLWLTIPAGVLSALIAGLLMGAIALRTRTHYFAMATLAFGFIVEIVVQRWVELTGGSMGLIGLPKIGFGTSQDSTKHFFWVVAAACLTVQIGSDYVMNSDWGRRLRAVKESESFAATIGLNVRVWRAVTFVVSAMMAGLAGAFFVHQSGYVSSDAFGLDRSIMFLIAVVVGGLGRPYGAILGSIVFIALGQLTADLYQVSYFIYGSIFLIVLILFPTGVSGLLEWLAKSVLPASRPMTTFVAANDPLALNDSSELTKISIPVLELENVSKSYLGIKAVDGVSIAVRPCTVHALIGPNGAGKSTLINLISGLYKADSGVIRLYGRDVAAVQCCDRVSFGIARCFQNLKLIGSLTVIENVMLGLPRRVGFIFGLFDWLTRRHVENSQRAEAMRLLCFFGIERFADASPGDLAYGHQKLLEMARALAQRPKLLLLDEPVAGLNEEEANAVAEVVRQLPKHGITVLVVEHNMKFVMGISNAVTVLDYGRVIAEGSPADVQHNASVIEAYLGAPTFDKPQRLRGVQ